MGREGWFKDDLSFLFLFRFQWILQSITIMVKGMVVVTGSGVMRFHRRDWVFQICGAIRQKLCEKILSYRIDYATCADYTLVYTYIMECNGLKIGRDPGILRMEIDVWYMNVCVA